MAEFCLVHRRVALLAAGLLATAPACAQGGGDTASAEERPGRFMLVPMSVERPAGEHWAIVRRSDTEIDFVRPARNKQRGQVAFVKSSVPDQPVRTIDELVTKIRADLHGSVDSKRFSMIEENVRPEENTGQTCVRYRQQLADPGAPAMDGQAQSVALIGRACLHPFDPGIVITSTLTERGPAAGKEADFARLAESFFKGVRPYRPLSGMQWQERADAGDADAQVWLARSLIQAGDPQKAIEWLKRAAEKYQPEAQALLGIAYLGGQGVTKSTEEALRYLHQAAARNYPRAEGLLAWTLISASEVRNESEGLRWARKAAQSGDPLGQALYGEILLFGRAGQAKDVAQGAQWIRKAAEQGEAKAQFVLARLLFNGNGLPKDKKQGGFWLELAAAQGHQEARAIGDQARPPLPWLTTPPSPPTGPN